MVNFVVGFLLGVAVGATVAVVIAIIYGRSQRKMFTALAAEALDANSRRLGESAAAVAVCQRCPVLVGSRTQTVFGVGDPNARLCFIGEAPGYDEDQQGEPFVGRAGQLLNRIISACKMRREEVYIANILKCRPPDNRTPQADEMANCREYLERQLEIIRPEFICCLGAVAGQALLGTTQSIGRLRGRFFDYRGIKLMCTYHPAYVLRNPQAKGEVWTDMKILLAAMGRSV